MESKKKNFNIIKELKDKNYMLDYEQLKKVIWYKDIHKKWHHNTWQKFLNKKTKVFSIGSCFAVNFGRWIKLHSIEVVDPKWGMHYNPYTILSEIKKAGGISFKNQQVIWKVKKKNKELYIDGLRHPILAYSFSELKKIQQNILNVSKKGIVNSDLIIITLGLSEIWEERTNTGEWVAINRTPPKDIFNANSEKYRNRNMSVSECKLCISEIIKCIKFINKKAKIVFTVSPMPLKTSFKDMSIRISNNMSKANLLSAIYEVIDKKSKNDSNIIYFPAYEIFMSEDSNKSWQDDMRHPTKEAVERVCKEFVNAFAENINDFKADVDFFIKRKFF